MAFTWADVCDLLEGRSKRMGIADDIADLLMAAYGILQEIVDTYDLSAYTVFSESIFVTVADERTYALPDDFGRLLHSHDEVAPNVPGKGESGLLLDDGTGGTPSDLIYEEPIIFRRSRSLTSGPPARFTLSQRTLVLDPAPDAVYTGLGVYIARVERPDLDADVLLDEPTILVARTLTQVAQDRGLPQAQMLKLESDRLMSALVNNQHRAKQKYYSSRWPIRSIGR
jgi:hypothetical protein